MRNVMRFRLIKTQPALEYIRDGLQEGCSLSRSLLQRLMRANVRIGAWLPPDIPEKRIYQFKQGGISPQSCGEAFHLPSGGVLVPIPTMVPVVAHYLYRHLAACRKQGRKAFLLAPDELASPSDPWVARYHPPEGSRLLFWGDEVYFYVTEDTSAAGVEQVLRHARSFTGMFSYTVFAHGDIEQDCSAELVIPSVRLFVVQAYDGESFLLVKFVDS